MPDDIAIGGLPVPRPLVSPSHTDEVFELVLARVPGEDEIELSEMLRRSNLIGILGESGESSGEPEAQANEFRVFARRSATPTTRPTWGSGAAVERTIGPLPGADRRLVWFDFFLRFSPWNVYREGEDEPAVLLPRPRPANDGIEYQVGPGSVWIRADLLDANSPPAAYVGVRIAGGRLSGDFLAPEIQARLVIPTGASCRISLNLATPLPVAPNTGAFGRDAAAADLDLPSSVVFEISGAGVAVTELDDASWNLFGEAVSFNYQPGGVPSYEEVLGAVVVPMEVSATRLEPTTLSPLAHLTGVADISRSGWVLRTALIDTDQATAAADGGLGVQADAGLDLSWTGLEEGPAAVPNPWITLEPGVATVADAHASCPYGHQAFPMWDLASDGGRTGIELRYTDDFATTWTTDASGTETINTTADALLSLDRPVDVRGMPLAVRTLRSDVSMVATDVGTELVVLDDDILLDRLTLASTQEIVAGEILSLAVRNALFTVTPVARLDLKADMGAGVELIQGDIRLGLGLCTMTPTLPDPYAARIGLTSRVRNGERQRPQATLLLWADLVWPAGTDGSVATRFDFGPLEGNQDPFIAWRNKGKPVFPPKSHPPPVARDVEVNLDDPPWAEWPGPEPFAKQFQREAGWWDVLRAYEQEQFALVDVSTNADLLGVSFAWSPRIHEREPSQGFPLLIDDLDLCAVSGFVRTFTLPQVSWEPLENLTESPVKVDPPTGHLLFPNDGGPTRLLSDGSDPVPIAPIPVIRHLVDDLATRLDAEAEALFTLPFGIRARAVLSRRDPADPSQPDPATRAHLSFNEPKFGSLVGGIQLRVDAPEQIPCPTFEGSTLQVSNLLTALGTPTYTGTLGGSVGEIFNRQFNSGSAAPVRRVPLKRIDLSGYGESTFSHWEDPNAEIAQTSQAYFDVFVARTAHEVIQVRSIVYPWAIRVVRTITLFRGSAGRVYRVDSGWQAESAGVYDFRYHPLVANQQPDADPPATHSIPSPYRFHPGLIRGVFEVRNIRETESVPGFMATWKKNADDHYVNDRGEWVGAEGMPLDVDLRPVYFDADVEIDGVESAARNGRVPSRKMLGYVQIGPAGEPISPDLFVRLLEERGGGTLGGPVDCVIDVAQSGQKVRVSRVDVGHGADTNGRPVFVPAARGAVKLPKDGAWSVVHHHESTRVVTPLGPDATVPVVRRGELDPQDLVVPALPEPTRLADPKDIITIASDSQHYGLLQSIGTQKGLFSKPAFTQGSDVFDSDKLFFADAYRMVKSSAIFPNLTDAVDMGQVETTILSKGYRLIGPAGSSVLDIVLPDGPIDLVKTDFLRIYVEYADNDRTGANVGPGTVQYGFDSEAALEPDRWLSKVDQITLCVDLGPLERMMIVRGGLHGQKGSSPSVPQPKLEFSDALKPVLDLLEILSELQGGDYAEAFAKGLDIAMSNSADSWTYAFHARKEIPLVKFPPEPAYSGVAAVPLKLEAHMAVGVYFNESVTPTSDPSQLVPSAGAFLEFGGRMSVMCASLGVASVYATGAVDLVASADTGVGPRLTMKFGFGVEVAAALPVVGNVSLLFMVGVEMAIDATSITVSAFLLFRGRAELLGGIVSVGVEIEAKGSVRRDPTGAQMTAQVTFGINISIFLVIDISFSTSWSEARQIA